MTPSWSTGDTDTPLLWKLEGEVVAVRADLGGDPFPSGARLRTPARLIRTPVSVVQCIHHSYIGDESDFHISALFHLFHHSSLPPLP